MNDILLDCIVEAWIERTWKKICEIATLLTCGFIGAGGGVLLGYIIWGHR